jgi:plastocyanin
MRRLVVVLACTAAFAAAAPAVAMDGSGPAPVTIEFAAFSPPRIQVLAGDTVTWHNDSVRTHTVTATDGTWSSLHLPGGSSFSHRFDAPGAYTYYCQIHPFMQGEVDAARLLLDAPTEAASPGRPFVLRGRAALAAGTAVTIDEDDGAGPRPVASATVGDDGRFTATITPRASATFTALAGSDASPPVRLLVLDRKVRAARARHGRTWVVTAHVSPASPGATVVLQLHLRERFGWWPQQTRRLDRHSTVRFRLRLHRRVRARVALTLRDGAAIVAHSRPQRVGRRS